MHSSSASRSCHAESAVSMSDVSSYCCISSGLILLCVLILLTCVRKLLYICPHTTTYVSSYYYICVILLTCFHTLLHMCPHAAIHVSSYCYVSAYCLRVSANYNIYVRILLHMCPHTNICVLILLYMCPQTAMYVSSCY